MTERRAPHSWSPESRAKLSATTTGRKFTPQAKANHAAAMARPETRAKISAALRGKPHSPEHNAAVAAAKRGHRLSLETRIKITAAQQSERILMQQIMDLAEMRGWLRYHPWLSVHSEPGFPDLTLVREDRLVFIEVKSGRGKLTRDQRKWLEALEKTGVEVYVIRPAATLDAVEALLQ